MQNSETATTETFGAVEWPTVGLAAATYAVFAVLTWSYHVLPWWVLLPCGAFLVCLHGSLQHEAIHRHPFRATWLNAALVFPALGLWMPYGVYRRTHLAHHRTPALTCPDSDPESFYLAADVWVRLPRPLRAVLWFNNCLAGRLSIGPALTVARFWLSELARAGRGDRSHLPAWGLHAVSVTAVLVWVIGVCDIPLWSYVLLFAYPGLSLTLLRSFAEHRPAANHAEASALIEAGPVMRLLYLGNNYHALHHARPALPWYRLAAAYRKARPRLQVETGGYVFRGYSDLFRAFFFNPKDAPLHPGSRPTG